MFDCGRADGEFALAIGLHLCITNVMAKDKTIVIQKSKKMGRPVTVKGEHLVAMRLSTEMLQGVDEWARRNADGSRSTAIRQLIERGLTADVVAPKRTHQDAPDRATNTASDSVKAFTAEEMKVIMEEIRGPMGPSRNKWMSEFQTRLKASHPDHGGTDDREHEKIREQYNKVRDWIKKDMVERNKIRETARKRSVSARAAWARRKAQE